MHSLFILMRMVPVVAICFVNQTLVQIPNSNSHKLKTVNNSVTGVEIVKSLGLFIAQMRNHIFAGCSVTRYTNRASCAFE